MVIKATENCMNWPTGRVTLRLKTLFLYAVGGFILTQTCLSKRLSPIVFLKCANILFFCSCFFISTEPGSCKSETFHLTCNGRSVPICCIILLQDHFHVVITSGNLPLTTYSMFACTAETSYAQNWTVECFWNSYSQFTCNRETDKRCSPLQHEVGICIFSGVRRQTHLDNRKMNNVQLCPSCNRFERQTRTAYPYWVVLWENGIKWRANFSITKRLGVGFWLDIFNEMWLPLSWNVKREINENRCPSWINRES